MHTETSGSLLGRVRKLLAKAEGEGVTPAEAEALTAKAAELMAKYGIDRALLAAQRPGSDRPCDRVIEIANPWARVQAHLLCGVAAAMRCQCVILPQPGPGARIHVFGFSSDVERAEVLYTSVLVQMWRGLAGARAPGAPHIRAWRRSWLLGFAAAVVARVRAAEEAAAQRAAGQATPAGAPTELVLADRSQIIRRTVELAYPRLRRARVTYTGHGYRAGYSQGQRADIGAARLRPRSGQALTGRASRP